MSTHGARTTSVAERARRGTASAATAAAMRPVRMPKLPANITEDDRRRIKEDVARIAGKQDFIRRATSEPGFLASHPMSHGSTRAEEEDIQRARNGIRNTLRPYKAAKNGAASLTPTRPQMEANLRVWEQDMNRYVRTYYHTDQGAAANRAARARATASLKDERQGVADLRARIARGDLSEPTMPKQRAGESEQNYYTRLSRATTLHDTWLKAAGSLPGHEGSIAARETLASALSRQSDMNVARSRQSYAAESEQRAQDRARYIATGRKEPYLNDLLAGRPVAVRGSNGVAGVIRTEPSPSGGRSLVLYTLGRSAPEGSRPISSDHARDDIAAVIGHTEGQPAQYLRTLSPDWSPPQKGSSLARDAKQYLEGGLTNEQRDALEQRLLGVTPAVSGSGARGGRGGRLSASRSTGASRARKSA